MAKKIIIFTSLFLLFFISILIIFQKSFSAFFIHDDFFLFSISRALSWKQFLLFFIPRNDVIYYRPISIQIFYFIFYKLFGLHVFYYHLFQFIIHAFNGVLVYILLSKINSNKKINLLASFLFVTSWTHIYELTWSASTFNSIGLFFILMYVLSYLSSYKKTILPELFLIFSLLSVETAVISPVLLILILWYLKKNSKKDIFRFCVHGIILGIYLYIRFILYKIPAHDSYEIGLSQAILKNIILFFLWLFNFSEIATNYIKINLTHLSLNNELFTNTFPVYSRYQFIFLVILFITMLVLTLKKIKQINSRLLIFSILWFFIALSPIIIIPKRAYPYYPFVAQIGFWLGLSYFFVIGWRSIFIKFALVLFIIGNILTVYFNGNNHWLFSSSHTVSRYYQKLQTLKLPSKKQYFYWEIDQNDFRNALEQGLAFNVFFNDYKIKFFLEEKQIPQNLKEKIYRLN